MSTSQSTKVLKLPAYPLDAALLSTNLVEVDKQTVPIGTEPLSSAFTLRAEAPHRKPELLGVIRNSKMHGFMGDEIPKDEVWRHDKPPIKGQVLQW